MTEQLQGQVELVEAVETAETVKPAPKKRAAAKKTEVDYKKECTALRKEVKELTEALEIAKDKSEFYFHESQEYRKNYDTLNQKLSEATNNLFNGVNLVLTNFQLTTKN